MKISEWMSGNILVLTYVGDIDACASFVALEYLADKISKAKLTFSIYGTINKGGKKILDMYNFKPAEFSQVDLSKIDKIILIDTQENVLPENLKQFEILSIDHHSHGAKGKYVNPNAVSTTEIIYKIASQNKVKLTLEVAKAVLFGIISDTGTMRFAKNTTFKLVDEILKKYDLDYQKVLSELHEDIAQDEKLAWINAAKRIKIKQINGKTVLISYVGSYESSSAQKLMALGADIAIVTSRKGGETRIIGRSKTGIDLAKIFINITKIISKSTGGGHPSAAVLTVPEKDEEKALAEILTWISKL